MDNLVVGPSSVIPNGASFEVEVVHRHHFRQSVIMTLSDQRLIDKDGNLIEQRLGR